MRLHLRGVLVMAFGSAILLVAAVAKVAGVEAVVIPVAGAGISVAVVGWIVSEVGGRRERV